MDEFDGHLEIFIRLPIKLLALRSARPLSRSDYKYFPKTAINDGISLSSVCPGLGEKVQ